MVSGAETEQFSRHARAMTAPGGGAVAASSATVRSGTLTPAPAVRPPSPAVRLPSPSSAGGRTIPSARGSSRPERPTWPPTAGKLPPLPDSPLPPPDRLADTGPVGLHSFNLGYIPASVTPPRTWRRAAWFTIFSSGAALVGLLFVTSLLIGPVTVTSDIDSLPGLPTGLPFFTPPASGEASAPAEHNSPAAPTGNDDDHPGRPSAGGNSTDPAAPASSAATPGGGAMLGGGPTQTSGAVSTGAPSTGIPTTVVPAPPTVTTVDTGPPAVDPAKIGDRTVAFFSEVTSNVDAAADLTADTAHDDAKAIIEQNYGDISTIKVKSISLDPSDGLTVSVLQVTDKDGSVSTEQRTLQFTLTGDPKIENPAG